MYEYNSYEIDGEKCTGESGDIGDIVMNVKIAMQKIAWQS